MFTPDIILLSVALITLALIMILGFIHIGRTIKANSQRLLPIYQQDIEQGREIAENATLISMNVQKRLTSVTTGLEKLQAVVENELRRKKPVYHTSTSQTEMVTMEMGTAITPVSSPRITVQLSSPVSSPRIVELSFPRSTGFSSPRSGDSSNNSIITVLSVPPVVETSAEEPSEQPTEHGTEELTTSSVSVEPAPSADLAVEIA